MRTAMEPLALFSAERSCWLGFQLRDDVPNLRVFNLARESMSRIRQTSGAWIRGRSGICKGCAGEGRRKSIRSQARGPYESRFRAMWTAQLSRGDDRRLTDPHWSPVSTSAVTPLAYLAVGHLRQVSPTAIEEASPSTLLQ